MGINMLDNDSARAFFAAICEEFPCASPISAVIVTHLLPDRPLLLGGLQKLAHVALILAKPRSIDQRTKAWLSHQYPIKIQKNRLTDGPQSLELILSHSNGQPLVLLDIGGYFSAVANFLAENYPGKFLGIVEDTENGAQKYEKEQPLSCPVIHVARSPLKNPEDFLVGQSIVYSVEALLRQLGAILHGRTACVIGYGKLGRSIAHLLHARHVRTVVYDIDAVRLAEAMAHGFSVTQDLHRGLKGAGLVYCATGNLSLKQADFSALDNGAFVATVTSSDDELEIGDLHRQYRFQQITDYVTRYSRHKHHFFLMNRGQAVNFIHGAAVGPFIHLIQAELLASVSRLSKGGRRGRAYPEQR